MRYPIPGYDTEETTFFGRHYYAFNIIKKQMSQRNDKIKGIIIGPGLNNPKYTGIKLPDFDTNYTKTFQPYELANALEGTDFEIEVVDINEKLLNNLQKRPVRLGLNKNFWKPMKSKGIPVDETSAIKYYNSFFPQNAIYDSGIEKVIEIPDSVNERTEFRKKDIIQDPLKNSFYDIVIMTNILTHYASERTGIPLEPTEQVIEKIKESLKPNGIFVSAENAPLTKMRIEELLSDWEKLSGLEYEKETATLWKNS